MNIEKIKSCASNLKESCEVTYLHTGRVTSSGDEEEEEMQEVPSVNYEVCRAKTDETIEPIKKDDWQAITKEFLAREMVPVLTKRVLKKEIEFALIDESLLNELSKDIDRLISKTENENSRTKSKLKLHFLFESPFLVGYRDALMKFKICFMRLTDMRTLYSKKELSVLQEELVRAGDYIKIASLQAYWNEDKAIVEDFKKITLQGKALSAFGLVITMFRVGFTDGERLFYYNCLRYYQEGKIVYVEDSGVADAIHDSFNAMIN